MPGGSCLRVGCVNFLQNPYGDVGHRVHEADDPAVVLAPALSAVAFGPRVGDSHGDGEREVSAIGASLSRPS